MLLFSSLFVCLWICCFFFKQKTAYEMRISDWSSDVCSSDLRLTFALVQTVRHRDYFLPDGEAQDEPDAHAAPPSVQRTAISGALLLASLVAEIGRASCRERVCKYVYISVVAGSLKKKLTNTKL